MITARTLLALALTLALAAAPLWGAAMGATIAAKAERPAVEPLDPPQMAVRVGAGTLVAPDGTAVPIKPVTLQVAPPQSQEKIIEVPVPGDYQKHWDNWGNWPGKWQGKTLAVGLKPKTDEQGTLILGGLYRQIPPESVTVRSADGSKTFVRGEDYRYSADWGQLGNIDGRLGEAGSDKLQVTYTTFLQRLDLVQVGPDGKPSVKQGKSRLVCPQLPEPDAGHAAVAGIYVAPWTMDRDPELAAGAAPKEGANKALPGKHVVMAHHVLPVDPAPPVEPVNPQAVSKTLGKLRSGGEARIAFMGASVTLGAEAGKWWNDLWTEKNKGYPSRVVVGLRQRFPEATVTPIGEFKGGTTAKFGLERLKENVMPQEPDLVLLAFGGNDVGGPIGRAPNNPPEQFKEDMRTLIRQARSGGAEVMLVVFVQQLPWGHLAPRWPAYRQAMLELSKEEDVAVADVYTEWMNLASRGIPPFTQLHNWLNHPGIFGHQVYAETILRFFPENSE